MQRHTRRYRIFLELLLLGLLVGVALTAGPAQAASGVGPFYPEPAWDRKIAPINRFLILTNWASQAVLDKETGLVWERSPDFLPSNWVDARLACTAKTTGNRKGWRLPSFPELASLLDPAVTPGPTLPPGNPFEGVQSDYYWSATTLAMLPASAWNVNFNTGNVHDIGVKTSSAQVWCVRGGMNADLY